MRWFTPAHKLGKYIPEFSVWSRTKKNSVQPNARQDNKTPRWPLSEMTTHSIKTQEKENIWVVSEKNGKKVYFDKHPFYKSMF